jgi:hypothetical protein
VILKQTQKLSELKEKGSYENEKEGEIKSWIEQTE